MKEPKIGIDLKKHSFDWNETNGEGYWYSEIYARVIIPKKGMFIWYDDFEYPSDFDILKDEKELEEKVKQFS